jgi:hypothetical protein
MQTCLNERMIEHAVVFATGHKGEACQIGEHGPGAILAVESEQGALWHELVRPQVPTNGREALAQFRPVAPVAAIAKRAEPLEAVGLADHGPRAHHLPALAPRVAWSTDIIQPAKGGRESFALGQSALTGRLSRAIQVKDHPGGSGSIQQIPGVWFVRAAPKRAAEQIVEEEGTQRFDRLRGQRGQKAREGRAGREPITGKQGHEGRGKGPHPFVEGFQGAFPAEGVAEEDGEKVNDVIAPKAAPGKVHALDSWR